MKKQPQTIYLNIGFDPSIHPEASFDNLEDITWSKEKTHPCDLAYIAVSGVPDTIDILYGILEEMETCLSEYHKDIVQGAIDNLTGGI